MSPAEPDPEPGFPAPAIGYVPTLGGDSPCEWPLIPQENQHVSAEDYYDMAVEYLWRWTNGIFGLTEVSVRPCRMDCSSFSSFWGRGPYPWLTESSFYSGRGFVPVEIRGAWHDLGCRTCGTVACGCEELEAVILPGPVTEITEVLLDGEVLDPDAYKITHRRYLLRVDGGDWPVCQDLAAEPTEPDTFQVTYKRGVPVPPGGQVAAGILANEFAKAAANDSSCQLPKRLQTVTRQGVTVAMIDSFDNVDKGFTGIWLIDAWVNSIVKSPKPSRVISPDYRPQRQRRH